jgi:hypothetical protein
MLLSPCQFFLDAGSMIGLRRGDVQFLKGTSWFFSGAAMQLQHSQPGTLPSTVRLDQDYIREIVTTESSMGKATVSAGRAYNMT